MRAHAAGPARGAPFCCFVSTAGPHDSYAPPERFLRLYDPAAIRLSPTLRDEPDGKPEIVRRMRRVWASLTDVELRPPPRRAARDPNERREHKQPESASRFLLFL